MQIIQVNGDNDSWNYMWGNGNFHHKRLIYMSPCHGSYCSASRIQLDLEISLSNETKKYSFSSY
jgi:hypothetical protein